MPLRKRRQRYKPDSRTEGRETLSRISRKFEQLKEEKRKALITFITAGDPSLKATASLIHTLEANGADIIELGVPFSDPLADGPTIQRSYIRALKKEVTLKNILALVKDVRKKSEIPLVIMSSYNLIFGYGNKRFIKDAKKAGLDGIIVPDLPPEEKDDLHELSVQSGIDMIFLLAPTSNDSRLKKVLKVSRGFIYYISLAGITGQRKELDKEIKSNVEAIKKKTKLPVAVGFGISTPAQAAQVASISDGVIIGSAIVQIVEKNGKNQTTLKKEVGAFVQSVRKKMDSLKKK